MIHRHIPKIEVKTIEHKKQRYNTVDDYYKEGHKRIFKISKLNNADYEFLLFIHALTEWYLTERIGITEETISKFDKEHKMLDDPGRSKKAPYHKEHLFAEKVEKLISKKLGVDWDRYDKVLSDIIVKRRKNEI